jgi:hypothetical protein
VIILVPPTSDALVHIALFTTGFRKGFAVSGELTNEVLPKSNIQRNGKHFPSKCIKNK